MRGQPDRMDDLLAAVRSSANAARGPECPDEGVWFEVAGKIADPAVEASLLSHAAGCDFCGGQLKRALQDFEDLPTMIEIKSAPSRQSVWWKWAIAAALFLAASAGMWFEGLPIYAGWRARGLLAESQKGARYTPFRLADSPYAATNITRGAADDHDRLIDAAALAKEVGGMDGSLLEARIQLAGGRPGDAAGRIEAAIRQRGETADLANDLGVALAESGGKQNYSSALEAFDRSLSHNHAYAPALYNRARVLGLLGRGTDACAAVAAFHASEANPLWRRDLDAAADCPQ